MDAASTTAEADCGHPCPCDVTVVLPTLNGEDFIEEQLQALLDQVTTYSWELVVVDSGSTDDTLGIVESRSQRLVPQRLVRLPAARGVSAAINAGISASSSPLVLIAEHDDVVAPGWIQALGDALQDHEFVCSQMERFRLNDDRTSGSRRHFPKQDPRFMVPIGNATGMGFRRRLWDALDGFDESYRFGGNDLEFIFRAHRLGHELHPVPGAVVHYRARATPQGAFTQARSYGLGIVRVYREHGKKYIRRRRLQDVAWEYGRLGWWIVRSMTSASYRMRLAFRGGLQVGFLEGSLRFRKFFP